MTANTLAQAFSALSADDQAKHLARWAHSLTIDARQTYIAGTVAIADPVRLRSFNEVQHRVVGHLMGLLNHGLDPENQHYPDEVFMAMLLDAVGELRASQLKKELEELEAGKVEVVSEKR